MLSLVGKVVSYQKYVYLLFVMIMVTSGYIILYPNTKMTNVLTKLDIYHWNTKIFLKDKIIYTKGEIELMEESMKYKDICVENNRFIILGNENKNVWFYSITNMIPTLTLIHGDSRQLYLTPNPTLETWNAGTDYDCAIYFYEDKKKEYEEEKYEVLYSNREGSILKRRKT